MANEQRAVRRAKAVARPKKVTTPEERDRLKDIRLQHKFGITLADRQDRERQQNYRCAVCGGPLNAHGHPCVDHFHFYIEALRAIDKTLGVDCGWTAAGYNEKRQPICVRTEKTKAAAIAAVKKEMMPGSIRGILCGKCNYGLGCIERFFDAARHPENLYPVIEYLRKRLTNIQY